MIDRRQLLNAFAQLATVGTIAQAGSARTRQSKAQQSAWASETNAVYYWDGSESLQAGIDNTPAGGKMVLEPGRYEPSVVGTAIVNKPLVLDFIGAGEGSVSAADYAGAWFDNTTGDIDGPIIQMGESGESVNSAPRNINLRRPMIDHRGSGPAIVNKAIHSEIHQPIINVGGDGTAGLELPGTDPTEWGITVRGGQIAGNDYAIHDRGAIGGMKNVIGTRLSASNVAAFRAQGREWTHAYCDYAGSGTIGVLLQTDHNTLIEPRMEGVDTGVHFDTRSRWNNVWGGMFFSCATTGIRWTANLEGNFAHAIRDINGRLSKGHLLFDDGCYRPGVSAAYYQMRDWIITDNGATRPNVQFVGTPYLTAGDRKSITSPTTGMAHVGPDGLVFHDGSRWLNGAGAAI